MIIVNGKAYSGNNVTVINNKVIIDGKQVDDDSKQIDIKVNGNINSLKVDSCNDILVEGDVEILETSSGDVNIKGNVLGDVSTISGDIECKEIHGRVKTISGDIDKNFS